MPLLSVELNSNLPIHANNAPDDRQSAIIGNLIADSRIVAHQTYVPSGCGPMRLIMPALSQATAQMQSAI